MTTPRMLTSPPITRGLVESGAFAADPFVLVDVGASGGIEEHWRVFSPALRSYGFDVLVKEVARLNEAEASPEIRYFEGFVGCAPFEGLPPGADDPGSPAGWWSRAYERSSAVRGQNILSMSFTQRFNNDDPEIVVSDKKISLDGFFAAKGVSSLDFVKIDTDGHDYEVLCGASDVVRSTGVLGFFVECQLHGPSHLHSNTFSNIDRWMRERGFVLFDLETYRYTRATLPGRYQFTIPAQTFEGPVAWSEAFYARDLAATGYDAIFGFHATPAKLAKLLTLFEIFGLPDCGAELLVERRAELSSILDVDAALDALARQMDKQCGGFAELNARFEKAPDSFYPQPGEAPSDPLEVRRLRQELRNMESTISWRLTAPLRRLKQRVRGES